MASKIVYVLGAGFSREAALPLQGEILGRVTGRYAAEPGGYPPDPDLRKVLEGLAGRGAVPTIEDLFTLLDQTTSQKQSFLGLSWKRLENARRALMHEVLILIHEATERAGDDAATFYWRLACHLVERRLQDPKGDPISIISLNWDCVLENSVYHCAREAGAVGKIDVDYCCYTTPLGPACPHTPSILQRAKGLCNIKVVKPHGSANWLLCSNCLRLYTGVGAEEDRWNQYVVPPDCPFCHDSFSKHYGITEGPVLEPFFVTPTFLKVFDNPHIRMVWHNAHIELAEATEVVFIGYSLPHADYHLRTLLRRAIPPDARLSAVLTSADDPRGDTPANPRDTSAVERYRSFFGTDRIEVDLSGVRGYFEKRIGSTPLADQLREMRRLLNASTAGESDSEAEAGGKTEPA